MPGRTQAAPPAARRAPKRKRRRAVADRALAGQVVRRRLERGERGLDAGDIVGIGVGEMRHQHDRFDLRQRVEAQPRGAIAIGREAEPVHAAVHLQEDAVRPVGLERGEPVDLARLVDDVPQVQARAGLEVAPVEAAFEEKDRAAPAEIAQPLGLGDVEQREAVGALQRGK